MASYYSLISIYRSEWHWIVVVVIIKKNWFVYFYLLSVLSFIFSILVHSALVLDSYTHDQNKLEPYSIQAVKDIEAFLQIVLRSVTLSPHPYKVYYTIIHYLCLYNILILYRYHSKLPLEMTVVFTPYIIYMYC